MTITSTLGVEDEIFNEHFLQEEYHFEYPENLYELRSRDQTKKINESSDCDDELPNFKSSTNNYTKFTNTAFVVHRYGFPSTGSAALATAVLIDYKVITKEDKSQIIEKNKIEREKARVIKEIQSSSDELHNLTGLYFDGRRDETLQQTKVGQKFHRGTIIEDHYTLISEPGSQYITQISPVTGDAAEICNTIWEYFDTEDRGELKKLLVVRCDGRHNKFFFFLLTR